MEVINLELKIDQLELSESASDLFVQKVVFEIKPVLENVAKQLKQKEWLSLGEACEYIGVSRSTLNTHFIERGLQVSKIQQVKRISKKDIDDFLNNNKI